MIKKAKELVDSAVKQIVRYQSGVDRPIRTHNKLFNKNTLGGIFKGNIITLAGVSGSGKTFLLQQFENDMFNKDLNPDCDDYVLLRVNWEMSVFKLLLRRLKQGLKESISEILFGELHDSLKERMKHYCDMERNPNIYYMEEPTTPEIFNEQVRQFLEDHKDKKHIVVTIDHLALARAKNGNKKQAIDETIEYISQMSNEYDNVSFIPLTQMNREIEARSDVRFLSPRRGDVYASDTIFHISDVVIAIHNPFKLGHPKYMVVDTKDYKYLEKYMTKPDDIKSNFMTKGLIFHHYLKLRELDDDEGAVQDIYIQELPGYGGQVKNYSSENKKLDEEYQEKVEELEEKGFRKLESLENDKFEDDIPF